MLHTEKTVSKKYSKKYHWSPKLSLALKALHYWQIRLQVAKGNPFNQNKLSLLQQHLNKESGQLNLPMTDIVHNLRSAKQVLREYQQQHIQLREEHLKSLAEARVVAKNTSLLLPQKVHNLEKRITRELHHIKKKESQRTMHSRIDRALHPGDMFRGLQSVDIPATENSDPFPIGPDPKTWSGPWRTVSNPEEIAIHVCAANARQYHRPIPLPFVVIPYCHTLAIVQRTMGQKILRKVDSAPHIL